MPSDYPTVLELVGGTAIVRLDKLSPPGGPQILAKLEYLNPGGSVKDRIGLAMIEAAEREGKLKPGGTIVEPTSGNTGVGLAIAAAIKGYQSIFVMPDKMSQEKISMLRAYGAEVVICPTAVEPESPESYYSVSDRLAEEIPGHPYQGMGDYPPEYREPGGRTYRWWFTHLPVVRQVMIENGDAAKPIWFTEFGWSAHANWPGIENWQRGVTLEQQADYLIRALRYAHANYPYVEVMLWYKERARPGGNDVVLEGYGLLNADLSERPVYGALKRYFTGA